MNRFLALGVAALFVVAFNVCDLNAQCCGNNNVVSNCNTGCCNSVAPASNGCCNNSCEQPRRGLFSRMRARRAASNCCTPAPTNCCGQVAAVVNVAPVANCGTCNTGCNTGNTCCNNRVRTRRMYTSMRRSRNNGCNTGCNTGCNNGCGGTPVMMEGTIEAPGGAVVNPPTPDDV